MAEQREATEKAKTAELAKQIQAEKEAEELDRISGKKSSMDRGIDWMYSGQNASSEIAKQDEERRNEEYLLGKEYVPEGGGRAGDLDGGQAMEGVNAAVVAAGAAAVDSNTSVVSTYGGAVEPTVSDRNEAFRQRVEDPMFAISKEVYNRNQQYEKKKELYEKVVGGVAVDKVKKDRKKKKHKKRHRRKRSRSRSASLERERSVSSERSGRRRERKHRRYRSSSRDRFDSRRYRDEDRRSRSDRHDDEHRYRRRRGCSEDSYHRERHRSRPHSNEDFRGKTEEPEKSHIQKPAGYGLQGKPRSGITVSRDELGPNRELLKQKRAEREDTRRQQLSHRHSRKSRTAQEREDALAEMKMSARRSVQDHAIYEGGEEETPTTRDASFLNKIAKDAHGLGSSTDLSSRLSQNRFNHQKPDDRFL